ncbi:MAG: carbamoylphosphate synthase large subunit, partial [Erysipelotrichaceae bacterium]|nr:carbamoylphosphate synthase large subunit [Erysipelotrichaceae bacterium]
IKRKYYVAYVGRHPEFDYVLSYDDVRERYGDKIVIDTDVPAALAEAMGSHVFIYRTKTKKEMNSIMQAIAQRR